MPDAADPRAFLAGAVAIVAEYPAEVMELIADPRSGTRVLRDYPTLPQLRKACDVLYEPIEREEERAQARRDARPLLPRPARSPEQQLRVDDAVATLRRRFGIPASGLRRRGSAVPLSPIERKLG